MKNKNAESFVITKELEKKRKEKKGKERKSRQISKEKEKELGF
jgi:hypothetical protein